MAAEEPDFAGFLLSDETGQIAGTKACIERANLGTRLSEAGVFCGNGEVAYNMQYMASADGKSVYHGNDGLRKTADLHLHIQHVQTGHTIIAYISSVAFHIHVATGTEGHVAGSGEQYNADA